MIPITPNISPDQMANAINQNFNELDSRLLTNVIKDESGTPRIIMGKIGGGGAEATYGVKISKEGVDVTSTDNLSDLLFSTATADTLKIVETGEISLTKDAGIPATGTSVSHSVGVSPYVVAFWALTASNPSYGENDYNNWISLPHLDLVATGTHAGKVEFSLDAYADETEVHFQIYAPDWAGNFYTSDALTIGFRYFLCLPQASG